MSLKVGLLVGMEWSFPPAFIEEVNRRDEGVTAEFITLDATRMDEPVPYAVIIDRISHEVPFYRTYLKHAVLQGCTVVNNPFMWTADDKFFGASLAAKLGIAHPKTVVLPNREYVAGIDHEKSLRNLRYPIDWQGVVDYVGLPCVLKDAHGGGWRDVYICHSLEELIQSYDETGRMTMVVQEFIHWDRFVRCIALGQEVVLPIKYDPRERRYHVEHEHLTPELGRRIVDDSLTLMRALGYDMCSLEWAVKDGVPYAIDFMNPAPDMDVNSLTPHYFDWVVRHMADMAIRLAKAPRPQRGPMRWEELFTASRHPRGWLADDAPEGAASGGSGAETQGVWPAHRENPTFPDTAAAAGDLAEELPGLARGMGSMAAAGPRRRGQGGDESGGDRFADWPEPVGETPAALSPDAPGNPSIADPAHQTDPTAAE
jgi:hypothetical protein